MTIELIFDQPLSDTQTDDMVWGTLKLISDIANHEFTCTSGLAGWQYSGAVKIPRRGPLPSCNAIGKKYSLITQPVHLDNPGIEGNFYMIRPYSVEVSGVIRGE